MKHDVSGVAVGSFVDRVFVRDSVFDASAKAPLPVLWTHILQQLRVVRDRGAGLRAPGGDRTPGVRVMLSYAKDYCTCATFGACVCSASD